jgi:hypothetical protein
MSEENMRKIIFAVVAGVILILSVVIVKSSYYF